MKFLLLLVLLPAAFAHASSELNTEASPGAPYISLKTIPEPLEPGLVQLLISYELDGVALPDTPLTVYLERNGKTILSSYAVTDTAGVAAVSVWINNAGMYNLTVTSELVDAEFEVHVHGRAFVVIGFLLSLAVLLALLFDRQAPQ